MRDTKGFTLIELLAVIVILAIVALVTAPAILNVINDSRMKGAQDKAWGTIEAVKLAFSQAQALDNYNPTDNFDVTFPGSTKVGSGTHGNITVSGDKPTGGTVTVNVSTGQITCSNLKFEGNGIYYCTSDGNKMCCKTSQVNNVNDCNS